MGIEKRHLPGELDRRLKAEIGPDGKLRLRPPAGADEGPVTPETIAEERPSQAPDPRPGVPPNAAGF